MLGHRQFFRLFTHPVKVPVQYLYDNRIVVYPVFMRSFAGIGQPFITYLAYHAQYARTGFIRLFGVLLMFKHQDDIVSHIIADGFSLFNELVRRPFTQEAVCRSQVFLVGSVMIFAPVARMRCTTLTAVLYLSMGPSV